MLYTTVSSKYISRKNLNYFGASGNDLYMRNNLTSFSYQTHVPFEIYLRCQLCNGEGKNPRFPIGDGDGDIIVTRDGDGDGDGELFNSS